MLPRPLEANELHVDPSSGVLREARQVPSPNFDARPAGVAADLIIVHGISLPPGEFGGPWIDRLFTNSLPADAHPYFAENAGRREAAIPLLRDAGVRALGRSPKRAPTAAKFFMSR